MAAAGDIEKMVGIGLVWGATNALIRRGALLWDQRQSLQSQHNILKRWLCLLFFWLYSLPFLLNLSASANFFAILRDAPISLAVPVTNATTFAATAVFGMLLREGGHPGRPRSVGYGFYCDRCLPRCYLRALWRCFCKFEIGNFLV